MSDKRTPDERHLRVGEPETSAVGVPGVAVSLRYALTEMGAARSVRTLLRVNQTDGFDCPSCAWGDPAAGDRKHAEFCENGAKAVAWEATRKRVDAEFFAAHPVAFLRQQSDHWLESNGRLTEPMYLAPGGTHYEPVAWDDAFRLIAGRLRSLDDPNRALFYTSGRASNEAAFAYQLLARRLGTNNLPDCSNMCHESSGAALNQTIGIGKGTVTLEDISDAAGLIVVVGQNPGTNHPRMLTALEEGGQLNRELEALPTDAELAARYEAGDGLTAPEFAVLLAYVKITLETEILADELVDEAWTHDVLARYFPTPLRERFGARMAGHRLRREIISTALVNEVVNRGGTSFVYRAMEESGRSEERRVGKEC